MKTIKQKIKEGVSNKYGTEIYDAWGNKERSDIYEKLKEIYDEGYNSIVVDGELFLIQFFQESGFGMGATPDAIKIVKLNLFVL